MPSSHAALAEAASALAPGSFRHTVLSAARRFKATWVELGRLLVQVRDEESFREWGYESFEAYCGRELKIRKQTAYKLVRSFSFLHRHEPKALSDSNVAERAPAFEVVEVLAGAEERGQLSASEYRSIRDSIWDPERPADEVKRELAERFPRPVVVPPEDVQVRRLAANAKRLANDLRRCDRASRALCERADALAEEIQALATGE